MIEVSWNDIKTTCIFVSHHIKFVLVFLLHFIVNRKAIVGTDMFNSGCVDNT